jgi:NAD(P)-dependent dehydrogenase (short-subunit alcohol dehydrogenase family)
MEHSVRRSVEPRRSQRRICVIGISQTKQSGNAWQERPRVVVTGASSGIGRATAYALAAEGARLALLGRRLQPLAATARECAERGGEALPIPVDVNHREAVDAAAERAVADWGGFDVWVNNAAVSQFGRIDETPPEVYDRVLTTNLLGCVNGSRAAIRQFRRQGHGRLINVSSVVGMVGQTYTSAYVASKWAIIGLSQSLRMELQDTPDITVSTVLPASIDTPIFRHAANYTGRAVRAMNPVYPPEQVADAICALIRRPKRYVIVGNAGRMLALLRRLSPAMAEWMMARQVEKAHLDQDREAPHSAGNVLEPLDTGDGQVRDGWLDRPE